MRIAQHLNKERIINGKVDESIKENKEKEIH